VVIVVAGWMLERSEPAASRAARRYLCRPERIGARSPWVTCNSSAALEKGDRPLPQSSGAHFPPSGPASQRKGRDCTDRTRPPCARTPPASKRGRSAPQSPAHSRAHCWTHVIAGPDLSSRRRRLRMCRNPTCGMRMCPIGWGRQKRMRSVVFRIKPQSGARRHPTTAWHFALPR
jgi:hypothetical protein